jgi:hypothetical protein
MTFFDKNLNTNLRPGLHQSEDETSGDFLTN